MRTRLETRRSREDAVQRVLSSPDLVELILGQLPALCLFFRPQGGVTVVRSDEALLRCASDRDRWVASQVNTAFRRAALSLPWKALWSTPVELSSPPSLEPLVMLRSRNVTTWHVHIATGDSAHYKVENTGSAAALMYGRSTECLNLFCAGKSSLMSWLHHTPVPPSDAAGRLWAATPVVACLASLSRLTCLRVFSAGRWTDASWLSDLPQLKSVMVADYSGQPLRDLPALETLDVMDHRNETALEEWASPRLTALSFSKCPLRIGAPVRRGAAGAPGAQKPEARVWLSGLQRLELSSCHMSPHSTGLRGIVPGLTHLKLDTVAGFGERILSTLPPSQNLPVSLKCLSLKCHFGGRILPWPALLTLQDLVSLEIEQYQEFTVGDVAAAVAALTSFPALKHVRLRLRVCTRAQIEVQEGFKPVSALLSSRQGGLHLILANAW